MIFIGLLIILALVLFAPFFWKRVEKELEIFLFIMGCASVTITAQWSGILIEEALLEPLKLTVAVFVAGFVFRELQKPIAHNVNKAAAAIGVKWFVFWVIIILGLLSSVITAIIAALVLVEIVTCLTLDRKNEIILVILACFSIG
jgi:predicted cation transporter